MNVWEEGRRSAGFTRDEALEQVLQALNRRLREGPQGLHAPNPLPQVFILGCARSGSTLLLQWLAASGRFCYPTNIMSRFYGDPYVGALAHRALLDLDVKGEIFPERPRSVTGFRSTLGRAQGPAEPHDMGYFWKSYFRFGATQADLVEVPSAEELARLKSDLDGVRNVFGAPMVMKALQMNWQLDILTRLFPEALYLVTERDVFDNARSLLEARRTFFQDDGRWFSFKPAEHAAIAALPPFEQTLAQVHCTNRAVKEQLDRSPGSKVLHVAYRELCEAPERLFTRIAEALSMDPVYNGPASFPYSTGGSAEERRSAEAFLRDWKG